MKINNSPKWPKPLTNLSPEEQVISDDFMNHWHKILPNKYSKIDKFNHNYVVNNAPETFTRTLEIGAGRGEHLNYEKLNDQQRENYFALDIRENMIADFNHRFPEIHAVVEDCQERMNFDDGYFDRIIAIHVLEHLPNLPSAIKELYRLSDKKMGVLSIVIPCEGGLAYSLARKISTERIYKSRYNGSYRWLIEHEHINRPHEIFEELSPWFCLVSTTYFPFLLKAEFCNLCIGATFKPKIV